MIVFEKLFIVIGAGCVSIIPKMNKIIGSNNGLLSFLNKRNHHGIMPPVHCVVVSNAGSIFNCGGIVVDGGTCVGVVDGVVVSEEFATGVPSARFTFLWGMNGPSMIWTPVVRITILMGDLFWFPFFGRDLFPCPFCII